LAKQQRQAEVYHCQKLNDKISLLKDQAWPTGFILEKILAATHSRNKA